MTIARKQSVRQLVRVCCVELKQQLDDLILVPTSEIEQNITLMWCSIRRPTQIAFQADDL